MARCQRKQTRVSVPQRFLDGFLFSEEGVGDNYELNRASLLFKNASMPAAASPD